MSFEIFPERASDAALIEPLLDRSFGFDRHVKTVYRLRERQAPLDPLRFVAVHDDGGLLASLRFWPIAIEAKPALLLGPLAVEPALRGQGIGRALVRHGLAAARRQGHRICLVVGPPDYYGPFGFVNAASLGLVLPGPVELPRFQALELVPGALQGLRGLVGRGEAAAWHRRALRRAAVA